MAIQLDRPHLDELKELIRRGEQLCDRGRQTEETELDQFKQDSLLLLGSIGPAVEALYRRMTELDFRTPYRNSRFTRGPSRGILDPTEAYRTLEEMVGILKSAEVLVPTAHQERDKQPQRRKSPRPAQTPLGYSDRDDAILELIGADKFKHMANDALYKQFRRRLTTELDKDLPYNAFRLTANRIRKHHGFPSSQQLKKE